MAVLWAIGVVLLLFQTATASYLDEYPRIHFAGQFMADMNTINNMRTNYIDAIPETNLTADWNPSGTSEWAFLNCTVTSVVLANGSTPKDDPLVGKPIVNNVDSVFAKLVDLDPDNQLVSTVFGMAFGINWKADSNNPTDSFIADWIPSAITQDIWFGRQMPYCEDCNQQPAASHTATRLEKIKWAKFITSKALQDLKNASKNTAYLSVAATFYNYTRPTDFPMFTYGLVVGTIGVGREEESLNFPSDRVLLYQSPNVNIIPNDSLCFGAKELMNTAYMSVRGTRVTVDLGNSIALDANAHLCNFGPLYLGIQLKAMISASSAAAKVVEVIGEIPYREEEWYTKTAGVQDFKFSSSGEYSHFVIVALMNQNVTTLRDGDYASYDICDTTDKSSKLFPCALVILEEPLSFVRPMEYHVYRMEANDTVTVKLFAKQFGEVAKSMLVSLVQSAGDTSADKGFTYNSSATTDKGIATFNFTAKSIGQPRNPIDLDGQIFSFSYCTTDDCKNPGNILAFHIYSNIKYETPYFWDSDIQPILNQYERLYPVMRHILKLGNYEDVTKPGILRLLNLSMALDIRHPSYMPVTRDLSPTKQKMILEWLNSAGLYRSWDHIQEKLYEPPDFCKEKIFLDDMTLLEKSVPYAYDVAAEEIFLRATLGNEAHTQHFENIANAVPEKSLPLWKFDAKGNNCTVKSLQRDLQDALTLEFYTIPLYLTSLYSVKDDYNPEVKAVIRSVVMQEMLHMAQVANLMISVGGKPLIDHKDHAPKYPATGLPGGVLPRLEVHLKKASPQHIYNTFMGVEYPHKINISDHVDTQQHTIGQFYKHITRCIVKLGDDIFCKNQDCESKQLHWPWDMYEGALYKITDVKSAKQAIRMIVQQGEGASPQNPTYLGSDKLAHFYSFGELACMRHMSVKHEHEYSYQGEPIQFTPEGVWPMRDDPSKEGIPPNTQLYNRAKNFHRVYRSLLRKLQEMVDGNPDAIRDSVYIMEAMQVHAKILMREKFPTKKGRPEVTCGPIFGYEWDD